MNQYNLSWNLDNIANSPILTSYIQKNINDPWVNTPLFGYRHIDNVQKGVYGEIFTSFMMNGMGFSVLPPENRGHDRIISGHKTEIKFSLSQANVTKTKTIPDKFTMNHVSLEKDWERLIFVGVNHPETKIDPMIFWFSKADMKNMFRYDPDKFFNYFRYQQGGAQLENDDYMSTGSRLKALSESSLAKTINQW